MKTNVSGRDLYIRWRYENVPVMIGHTQEQRLDDKGKPVFTEQTTCILSAKGENLVEHSVRKWHEDKFDKEVVRKLTLGKLLLKAFPNTEERETTLRNKAIRTAFWKTYHDRIPPKKDKATKPTIKEEAVVVQLESASLPAAATLA